ncbi:MAG: GNAT family N-acetyltransferase [Desulfovibrio sp.]|uniref:GNAT family N-acetyltransferase n=1 Tax=Desulfovibrio sp. TaxID=885 RepID=UPI00135E7124|nr:GNAT family N-acetyltransferase [Desulfovibrio sp.]MTJ94243.1 GNAT family N-acetyltransferase [Desulfovibrio sp.]
MKILHGYNITQGTEVHVPLLAAIEVAAAGIFPSGSIPDHIRTDFTPVDKLFEAVHKGLLWVALAHEGSPVGYAFVQMVENVALLAQMDVHPGHMRRGIGTALVGQIAEALRVRNVPALYLTTFTHVPWNAAFYGKMGFVALDEANSPLFLHNILEEERRHGLINRSGMRMLLGHKTNQNFLS